MIPCMGGFCKSRESCAHYYAESSLTPSERLCGAVEEVERVRHEIRPVDSWEVLHASGDSLRLVA